MFIYLKEIEILKVDMKYLWRLIILILHNIQKNSKEVPYERVTKRIVHF